MQNDFDPLDHEQQDGERAEVRQARELAAKQAQADFVWLMSDPRGRRIVWSQLAAAGVFRSTFDHNPQQMAFAEGHRSAGLRLMSQLLTLTPDHYHTMTKENTQ